MVFACSRHENIGDAFTRHASHAGQRVAPVFLRLLHIRYRGRAIMGGHPAATVFPQGFTQRQVPRVSRHRTARRHSLLFHTLRLSLRQCVHLIRLFKRFLHRFLHSLPSFSIRFLLAVTQSRLRSIPRKTHGQAIRCVLTPPFDARADLSRFKVAIRD